MAVENVRKFTVKDYIVLDKARTMAHQYPNYQLSFKQLDADVFNDLFNSEFLQKIEIAENIPSDDLLVSEQVMETEDVHNVCQECADTSRSCKWYIKKASHGRKSFIELFNYNDLDTAAASPSKMITFMENFSYQVNRNLTILTEEGLPAGKYDEIELDLQELKKERQEQKDAIYNRSNTGEFRIRSLTVSGKPWQFSMMLRGTFSKMILWRKISSLCPIMSRKLKLKSNICGEL